MLVGCLQNLPSKAGDVIPVPGAPVRADTGAAEKTPDLSPASLMLMAPGSHLVGKSRYAVRTCSLDKNGCV